MVNVGERLKPLDCGSSTYMVNTTVRICSFTPYLLVGLTHLVYIYRLVVEMEYTSDLRSDAVRIEGSNPS